MSKLALDSLSRWIAEWVHPVPAAAIPKEAARLAAEFTAYAKDAGISTEHIEDELGEDLAAYMEDALVEAAESDSHSPGGTR
jgi:hypothetical protein